MCRSAPRAGVLALLALAAPGPATADPPRQDYVLHCMGCHREDGSGAPGAVPSLGGVVRFLAVPEGRAYLVQVPGTANSALDDAAVAALLNWMLAAFPPGSPPPAFVPYTADEVARYRAAPLLDAARTRAALLARLAPR